MANWPMVVTFTIWNRPAYLRQVLDGWAQVRGVDSVLLQFTCEPGCPEAVELCRAVDFAETRVQVNDNQLGAMLNTQWALDSAFRFAPYAILATDDFLPSDDVLELHAWHRDNYRDDSSVLSLVCGRGDAVGGGPAAVWRSQIMGWLPGFHVEKWAMLTRHWTESDQVPGGWYPWIDTRWTMGRGYDILLPALSRAQDIGEVGGTGAAPSRCFSPHYEPQQYYEVQGKRERGWDSRIEVCG